MVRSMPFAIHDVWASGLHDVGLPRRVGARKLKRQDSQEPRHSSVHPPPVPVAQKDEWKVVASGERDKWVGYVEGWEVHYERPLWG